MSKFSKKQKLNAKQDLAELTEEELEEKIRQEDAKSRYNASMNSMSEDQFERYESFVFLSILPIFITPIILCACHVIPLWAVYLMWSLLPIEIAADCVSRQIYGVIHNKKALKYKDELYQKTGRNYDQERRVEKAHANAALIKSGAYPLCYRGKKNFREYTLMKNILSKEDDEKRKSSNEEKLPELSQTK